MFPFKCFSLRFHGISCVMSESWVNESGRLSIGGRLLEDTHAQKAEEAVFVIMTCR
jgi:hypothetical protein